MTMLVCLLTPQCCDCRIGVEDKNEMAGGGGRLGQGVIFFQTDLKIVVLIPLYFMEVPAKVPGSIEVGRQRSLKITNFHVVNIFMPD